MTSALAASARADVKPEAAEAAPATTLPLGDDGDDEEEEAVGGEIAAEAEAAAMGGGGVVGAGIEVGGGE